MGRILIAVALLGGLSGCVVAPPPDYAYAPGYYPGYYYGPSVSVGVGVGGGCCWHGGWHH